MSEPTLSALVVAHNEEGQLAECFERLAFADETVIVLDRCTDGSQAIATGFGAKVVEGAWPIEGERRNAGIAACTSDWIIEVDADERLPEALADEIRGTIGAPRGVSPRRRACSVRAPSVGATSASTPASCFRGPSGA